MGRGGGGGGGGGGQGEFECSLAVNPLDEGNSVMKIRFFRSF